MPNRRINTAQLATKQPDPFGLATTYKFDQGCVASWTVTDPVAPTIRLTPLLDVGTVPPQTQWFAIRSGQWKGRKPVFLFDHTTFWFTVTSAMWTCCWATSPDTDTWTQFDNIDVGATDITFSHNTAFPAGVVYVAFMPLYPFSRTERKVREWGSNALVGETDSTASKIISRSSPASSDGNGRWPVGLPYYAFRVANATANTKNIAILSSRMHACEPIGGYSFEAAIDYLLTTSPEQKFLLDWFEFNCYPCLYPVNVVAGHSRDMWDDHTKDINQKWSTTGDDEAVDVFKTAMVADTGGEIEVGLDYHSMAGTDEGGLGDVENDGGTMEVAFRDQMITYEASFSLVEESLPNSLTHWWTATLGANLALYAEHGVRKTDAITAWKAYGSNTIKALVRMQARGYFTNGPGVGSRDFNGSTDRIDWASVTDTAGDALTISAWVYLDAYIANPLTAYVLCAHRSGDAAYGTVFAVAWSGRLVFFRSGTTGLARYSLAANPVGTGAWAHILVTHDGVMTTYSSIHLYINGTDRSDNTDAANGAGEYAASGKWSVGGRIYDDARNVNGKIAQVRVFNRVLSAPEIALEAAGIMTTTTGLLFYFKGNTDSLDNEIGGADGTADGTTSVTGVGNGPAIIYG